MAGTRVTDRTAANAIENVFVQASGENRRPSVPSSVNTGRKPTVMTRSEKKIGRPTSCSAEMTIDVSEINGTGKFVDWVEGERAAGTGSAGPSVVAKGVPALPTRQSRVAERHGGRSLQGLK